MESSPHRKSVAQCYEEEKSPWMTCKQVYRSSRCYKRFLHLLGSGIKASHVSFYWASKGIACLFLTPRYCNLHGPVKISSYGPWMDSVYRFSGYRYRSTLGWLVHLGLAITCWFQRLTIDPEERPVICSNQETLLQTRILVTAQETSQREFPDFFVTSSWFSLHSWPVAGRKKLGNPWKGKREMGLSLTTSRFSFFLVSVVNQSLLWAVTCG